MDVAEHHSFETLERDNQPSEWSVIGQSHGVQNGMPDRQRWMVQGDQGWDRTERLLRQHLVKPVELHVTKTPGGMPAPVTVQQD